MIYAPKGGAGNPCSYFSSYVTKSGGAVIEMSLVISKARTTYAELKYLWCRSAVSLKLEGLVYCAAGRSVLLRDCGTWILRVGDDRHLEIFGHRCLCNVATIGCD